MTTLAVRFDQELSVAHKIGSGFLPCPQGVVVKQFEYRWVEACEREWGHEDGCRAKTQGNSFYRRKRGFATVCGLDLDALPFVLAPSGLTACPACFADDTASAYIESELFA